jgi:hypothetical protein
MGDESEIVCPYCSTLYRFDPAVPRGTAEPASCMWRAIPDDMGVTPAA